MFEKENKSSTMLLLVTPVWRDCERLERFGKELADELAGESLGELGVDSLRWVIADDGSEADERKNLKQLHQRLRSIFPALDLHFADAHRGKGSVIREAWSLYPDAKWVAFVDADGSLSPKELIRLIQSATDAGQSVLAIRKKTATTRVVESLPRAIAHRLFIIAAKIMIGVRCEDPQCGAKVLLGADYRKVAGQLKEDGLAFDAELLAALSACGASWKELPVTWIEKEGGKVRILRDGWGMLVALWKIRIRQKKGEFVEGG